MINPKANTDKKNTRRNFIKNSAAMTLVAGGALSFNSPLSDYSQESTAVDNINFIGPKEGYSPQIGTLVSMMNWMRDTILRPVQGMSTSELDYIHDDNSNSIGAMLWHLASTERFYQLNTFEGIPWGNWAKEENEKWNVAMSLGDRARKKINGHSLDFYLDKLSSVREYSFQELAKRDDAWLLTVDEEWGWGPTNNYCKWFHVVEHESNHNGQIKYLKSRIS